MNAKGSRAKTVFGSLGRRPSLPKMRGFWFLGVVSKSILTHERNWCYFQKKNGPMGDGRWATTKPGRLPINCNSWKAANF